MRTFEKSLDTCMIDDNAVILRDCLDRFHSPYFNSPGTVWSVASLQMGFKLVVHLQ